MIDNFYNRVSMIGRCCYCVFSCLEWSFTFCLFISFWKKALKLLLSLHVNYWTFYSVQLVFKLYNCRHNCFETQFSNCFVIFKNHKVLHVFRDSTFLHISRSHTNIDYLPWCITNVIIMWMSTLSLMLLIFLHLRYCPWAAGMWHICTNFLLTILSNINIMNTFLYNLHPQIHEI